MAPSIPAARRSADYEQLCRFVGSRYCYFPTKATDWESAVSHYRVPAENASTKRTFVRVLEELLDELYDAHTHLTIHLSDSWRLPPHDVWAEWRDGKIVVTEVRSDSVAARAGLSVNTEIVGFNGGSIMQRVAARRPHFLLRPDPAAGHWLCFRRCRDGAAKAENLKYVIKMALGACCDYLTKLLPLHSTPCLFPT